jgi:hypothetical protein
VEIADSQYQLREVPRAVVAPLGGQKDLVLLWLVLLIHSRNADGVHIVRPFIARMAWYAGKAWRKRVGASSVSIALSAGCVLFPLKADSALPGLNLHIAREEHTVMCSNALGATLACQRVFADACVPGLGSVSSFEADGVCRLACPDGAEQVSLKLIEWSWVGSDVFGVIKVSPEFAELFLVAGDGGGERCQRQ